jgi:PKD repeat protein
MRGWGRRASLRAVGGALVLVAVAVAGPAAALAAQVPATARLDAHLVTVSPPARPGPAVHSLPPRVQNPARYALQKVQANGAYQLWASEHPQVFGPALTISAPITRVSKSGLNASQSGGATPPDTTGAIGPNFYIEMVNSRLALFNRNTLASPPVAQVAEDTFVHSSNTCDGQIKWDQPANRWLYYSLDCAPPSASSQGFSFGFSKTNNPLPLPSGSSSGNWCGYHSATGTTLEDYGKLGSSNSQMIIGANEFNMTTGNFIDSAIITFPKPPNGTTVTTCPTESGHKFGQIQFTPEPAEIFNSSTNGFVVAEKDFSHLEMYTVAGTTPTLTDNGAIPVPTFATPAGVPQPGSSDVIDSSDTRLTQANAAIDPALNKIAIWTQHTVAGSGGGPSVVRWYELTAGSAAAPVQTGTVSVSGAFAFNGAISPTAQGNAAAIDYNVGSSSLLVRVRAQDHAPGAAAGSMTNETTLATSTGINADFSCPSQGSGSTSCRWGDYGGASPDPTCRGTVYGTNELNGPNNAGSATWATQNFLLKVVPCPTASFTVSPTSPAHGSPATFDGSGSSSPNGPITKWAWSFGDGTTATTTTPTVNHTYAAAGTVTATLTVTDSTGLTGKLVKTITVT